MVDLVDLVDPTHRLRDAVRAKRRPTWLRETLREIKKHASPQGSFRESRIAHRFLGYMALMRCIIYLEPSTYEEVAKQQV